MASTTSTVDIEDGPILNERDVHWNRLTGSSEPDGFIACRVTGLGHFIYAQLSQLGSTSKLQTHYGICTSQELASTSEYVVDWSFVALLQYCKTQFIM